jgi:hypothetical protein
MMMCNECAVDEFVDCETCGLPICEGCIKEHECVAEGSGEESEEETTA